MSVVLRRCAYLVFAGHCVLMVAVAVGIVADVIRGEQS